jgi:hypothetical protein
MDIKEDNINKKPIVILLNSINKKFKLSDVEYDVLGNYVGYMHEESRIPFLEKVYASDRSYLEEFVDDEVDNMENALWEGKDDEPIIKKETLTKKELNSTMRLELYTRLIDKLRGDKQATRIWYDKLGFDASKYKQTKEKRKALYSKFANWLEELSEEELQDFFESLI